jgi:hypothetical protein
MIDLITVMPDETADHKRAHKHPFIVSELFSCEVPQVLDQFFNNTFLLQKLFSYLESSSKVPILDGYFSKLASALLSKNPAGFLDFLSNKEILTVLVSHLETRSISDFLLKILTCEVQPSFFELKKKTFEDVFDKLKDSSLIIVHHSKNLIIEMIAKTNESPVVKDLVTFALSGVPLKSVLEALEAENETTVACALEILKQVVLSPIHEELFRSAKPTEDDAIVFEEEELSDFSKTLISLIPKLLNRLKRKTESFLATHKKNLKVLGQDRLKISEFFLCLARTQKIEFLEEMRKNEVIEEMTQIFIDFEFNSFFHQIYENFFSVFIDYYANDEGVLEEILKKSKILERFANGCEFKGYAGHAVKIGTSILKVKARNSEFSSFIEENEDWKIFYFEFYAKRSEIERKTLGETRSKVSDDVSSDDSGHAVDAKNDFDAFFSKLKNKKEEDDFDRDEPEADSEPLDMDDLKTDSPKDEHKFFGETFGRGGKNRYGDDGILEMALKQTTEEDSASEGSQIADEEYWRF